MLTFAPVLAKAVLHVVVRLTAKHTITTLIVWTFYAAHEARYRVANGAAANGEMGRGELDAAFLTRPARQR